MNDDLEKQLHDALRPVGPKEGFDKRVMARIEAEQSRGRRQTWHWTPAQVRWLPVALAASVILGVLVAREWHVRREQQGLEARQQLIEALRVTGEKLDLAYRVVNAEPQPAPSDDSGA